MVFPSAARPNTEIEVHIDVAQIPPKLSLCADAEVRRSKTCFPGYKGYHSAPNREPLKELGIGDLIQHKASRTAPLQAWQRRFRALVAKVKFKIEQSCGAMKRRFHLSQARYFWCVNVEAQMVWAALGMSLRKAHRRIKQIRAAQGGSTV